eukprot:5557643-Prorocentrum_lima.AAC.1
MIGAKGNASSRFRNGGERGFTIVYWNLKGVLIDNVPRTWDLIGRNERIREDYVLLQESCSED